MSKDLAVQPHDLNLIQDYMGGERREEAGQEGKRGRTHTSCPLTTTCAVLHEQPSAEHIHNKYINSYKNVELFLIPSFNHYGEPTHRQYYANSIKTFDTLWVGVNFLYYIPPVKQGREGKESSSLPHSMNAIW